MSATAHEWVGTWECEAPLTPEEVDEDRPILEQITQAIPDGATIMRFSVWVHGREWRWRRIDATRVGSQWDSGVHTNS